MIESIKNYAKSIHNVDIISQKVISGYYLMYNGNTTFINDEFIKHYIHKTRVDKFDASSDSYVSNIICKRLKII